MQLLQFYAMFSLVLYTVLGHTVENGRFLYSRAPVQLVEEARAIGEYEKQIFHKEVAKLADNGQDRMKNLDTEMELYSKHLLTCSSVGSKLSHHLVHSIGDQASPLEEDSDDSRAQNILKAVGFDKVAIRMFLLPVDEIKSLIKTACLKHELQFQCADAFLNNPSKIQKNIERMKASDGNVKVMFEKECSKDEEVNVPELYSCIGSSADEVYSACGASLSVFNKSRDRLNHQIKLHYHRTLEELSEASDDQTNETEVRPSRTIETALDEIRRMEALRCRLYSQIEKCAVNTIVDQCGPKIRPIVKTLLRVGHLRRERGDQMHEHLFVDNEIPEHPNCSPYA